MKIACVLNLGLLLLLNAPPARAFDLVPYEAPGWKYLQVNYNSYPEGVFQSPLFDDSGWPVGQAAFGWDSVVDPCLVSETIHTHWDPNTDILLRRYFSSSPIAPITIYLSIDNDVTVYFNGTEIFSAQHEHCPYLDEFRVDVPTSLLSSSGTNLLAVLTRDRGWSCFVDIRIEGDIPVPTKPDTWGSIKALYTDE